MGSPRRGYHRDLPLLPPADTLSVAAGDCLLEWDGDGKAPVPLLKEKFASERRKAKVLNFSIAYGKTAYGLSKDWNVSLTEAEETVERWYSDRIEVSHLGDTRVSR